MNSEEAYSKYKEARLSGMSKEQAYSNVSSDSASNIKQNVNTNQGVQQNTQNTQQNYEAYKAARLSGMSKEQAYSSLSSNNVDNAISSLPNEPKYSNKYKTLTEEYTDKSGNSTYKQSLMEKIGSIISDNAVMTSIDNNRLAKMQAKYGDKVFSDNFTGQFGANFAVGRIQQEMFLAYSDYLDNPTEENKNYVNDLKNLCSNVTLNNQSALDDKNEVAPWLSRDIAAYLPQLWNQTKTIAPMAAPLFIAGAKAGAEGGAVFGTAAAPGIGTAVGGFTGGLAGGMASSRIPIIVGNGIYSYNTMRGSAFMNLIDTGISEEAAKDAAEDEAFLSSVIEMGDTALDLVTFIPGVGKLAKNLGEKATKKIASSAAKAIFEYAGNIGQEYSEEFVQEIISQANVRRAEKGTTNTGVNGLVKEVVSLCSEYNKVRKDNGLYNVITGNTDNEKLNEAAEAGKGGAVIGGVMGLAGAGANKITTKSYNYTVNNILNQMVENKETLDNLDAYQTGELYNIARGVNNDTAANYIKEKLDAKIEEINNPKSNVEEDVVDEKIENGKDFYDRSVDEMYGNPATGEASSDVNNQKVYERHTQPDRYDYKTSKDSTRFHNNDITELTNYVIGNKEANAVAKEYFSSGNASGSENKFVTVTAPNAIKEGKFTISSAYDQTSDGRARGNEYYKFAKKFFNSLGYDLVNRGVDANKNIVYDVVEIGDFSNNNIENNASEKSSVKSEPKSKENRASDSTQSTESGIIESRSEKSNDAVNSKEETVKSEESKESSKEKEPIPSELTDNSIGTITVKGKEYSSINDAISDDRVSKSLSVSDLLRYKFQQNQSLRTKLFETSDDILNDGSDVGKALLDIKHEFQSEDSVYNDVDEYANASEKGFNAFSELSKKKSEEKLQREKNLLLKFGYKGEVNDVKNENVSSVGKDRTRDVGELRPESSGLQEEISGDNGHSGQADRHGSTESEISNQKVNAAEEVIGEGKTGDAVFHSRRKKILGDGDIVYGYGSYEIAKPKANTAEHLVYSLAEKFGINNNLRIVSGSLYVVGSKESMRGVSNGEEIAVTVTKRGSYYDRTYCVRNFVHESAHFRIENRLPASGENPDNVKVTKRRKKLIHGILAESASKSGINKKRIDDILDTYLDVFGYGNAYANDGTSEEFKSRKALKEFVSEEFVCDVLGDCEKLNFLTEAGGLSEAEIASIRKHICNGLVDLGVYSSSEINSINLAIDSVNNSVENFNEVISSVLNNSGFSEELKGSFEQVASDVFSDNIKKTDFETRIDVFQNKDLSEYDDELASYESKTYSIYELNSKEISKIIRGCLDFFAKSGAVELQRGDKVYSQNNIANVLADTAIEDQRRSKLAFTDRGDESQSKLDVIYGKKIEPRVNPFYRGSSKISVGKESGIRSSRKSTHSNIAGYVDRFKNVLVRCLEELDSRGDDIYGKFESYRESKPSNKENQSVSIEELPAEYQQYVADLVDRDNDEAFKEKSRVIDGKGRYSGIEIEDRLNILKAAYPNSDFAVENGEIVERNERNFTDDTYPSDIAREERDFDREEKQNILYDMKQHDLGKKKYVDGYAKGYVKALGWVNMPETITTEEKNLAKLKLKNASIASELNSQINSIKKSLETKSGLTSTDDIAESARKIKSEISELEEIANILFNSGFGEDTLDSFSAYDVADEITSITKRISNLEDRIEMLRGDYKKLNSDASKALIRHMNRLVEEFDYASGIAAEYYENYTKKDGTPYTAYNPKTGIMSAQAYTELAGRTIFDLVPDYIAEKMYSTGVVPEEYYNSLGEREKKSIDYNIPNHKLKGSDLGYLRDRGLGGIIKLLNSIDSGVADKIYSRESVSYSSLSSRDKALIDAFLSSDVDSHFIEKSGDSIHLGNKGKAFFNQRGSRYADSVDSLKKVKPDYKWESYPEPTAPPKYLDTAVKTYDNHPYVKVKEPDTKFKSYESEEARERSKNNYRSDTRDESFVSRIYNNLAQRQQEERVSNPRRNNDTGSFHYDFETEVDTEIFKKYAGDNGDGQKNKKKTRTDSYYKSVEYAAKAASEASSTFIIDDEASTKSDGIFDEKDLAYKGKGSYSPSNDSEVGKVSPSTYVSDSVKFIKTKLEEIAYGSSPVDAVYKLASKFSEWGTKGNEMNFLANEEVVAAFDNVVNIADNISGDQDMDIEIKVRKLENAANEAVSLLAKRMENAKKYTTNIQSFNQSANKAGLTASGKKDGKLLTRARDFLRSYMMNPSTGFKFLNGFDKESQGYKYGKRIEDSTAEYQKNYYATMAKFLDLSQMDGFDEFASGSKKTVDVFGNMLSEIEAIDFLEHVANLDSLKVTSKRTRLDTVRGFCLQGAGKDGSDIFITLDKNGANKCRNIAREITENLSPVAKEYLKVSREAINEIGHKLSNKKKDVTGTGFWTMDTGIYYPLHYKSQNVNDSIDVTKDFGLEHESVVNKRTREFGGYVLVQPASKTTDLYIHRACNYVAYADIASELEYGAMGFNGVRSIQSTVSSAFGEDYGRFVSNYVKDINNFYGEDKDSTLNSTLRKLRGNLQRGALSVSLSVPIKQVASYWSASSVISPYALLKAYRFKGVKEKGLGKDNKLLNYRKVGGIDPTVSEVLDNGDFLANMKKRSGILKTLGKATSVMDYRTVDNLLTATILDVSSTFPDLDKNSNTFKTLVENKFGEAVMNTQPNFTKNFRAEYLRTNNELIRGFSMFRSQQTQNYNAILTAIGEYGATKGTAAGLINQAALKNTMSGQFAAAVEFGVLSVVADMILHKHKKYEDDDTEEIAPEEILKRVALNSVETAAGTVLFGDAAAKKMIDIISKAGKESTKEYYGVSFGGVTMITDAIGSVEDFISSPSVISARYALGSVAQCFGVPLNNAYNIVNSIVMWSADIGGMNKGDYDDMLRYAVDASKPDYDSKMTKKDVKKAVVNSNGNLLLDSIRKMEDNKEGSGKDYLDSIVKENVGKSTADKNERLSRYLISLNYDNERDLDYAIDDYCNSYDYNILYGTLRDSGYSPEESVEILSDIDTDKDNGSITQKEAYDYYVKNPEKENIIIDLWKAKGWKSSWNKYKSKPHEEKQVEEEPEEDKRYFKERA